jgi:hypothetical protein
MRINMVASQHDNNKTYSLVTGKNDIHSLIKSGAELFFALDILSGDADGSKRDVLDFFGRDKMLKAFNREPDANSQHSVSHNLLKYEGFCLAVRDRAAGCLLEINDIQLIKIASNYYSESIRKLDEGGRKEILISLLNTLHAFSRYDMTRLLKFLEWVPDRPSYAEEYACALSAAAVWSLKSGLATVDVDRYLGMAFGLADINTMTEVRPLFGALSLRLSRPENPLYGPGRGLGGLAGTLTNALSLADRLPDPELACFPVGFLLINDFFKRQYAHDDLRRVLEIEGLPDIPSLRFVWKALEILISSRLDTNGRPTSFEQSNIPDDHSSSDAWRLFDEFMLHTADPMGMGLSDRTAESFHWCLTAAEVLGNVFRRIPKERIEEVIRFLAPIRANRSIAPEAFFEFVKGIARTSTDDFRRSVMCAAADGLFGEGEALLQALVIGASFPGKSSSTLTSFSTEAETLRRLAGTPEDPGTIGMRIAVAFMDADFAARTEVDPNEYFKSLTEFLPDWTGIAYAKEIQWMCEYAFAGVMLAASHKITESQSTGIVDIEIRQTQSSEEQESNVSRLLDAIPKSSMKSNFFLQKAIAGAVFAEMELQGMKGGVGQLARACFSKTLWIEQNPLLKGAEALTLMHAISSRPVESADEWRELCRKVNSCLASPLPPNLRTCLTGVALAGFGVLGMPDEMEGFLYENLLMQSGPRKNGQDQSKLSSIIQIGQFNQISLPVPFDTLMKHLHLALGHGYALESAMGIMNNTGVNAPSKNIDHRKSIHDGEGILSGLEISSNISSLPKSQIEDNGSPNATDGGASSANGNKFKDPRIKDELDKEYREMMNTNQSINNLEQPIMKKYAEKAEKVVRENRKNVISKIMSYRRFMGYEIADNILDAANKYIVISDVMKLDDEGNNLGESLPIPIWEVSQFPLFSASYWCVSCHRYVTALDILQRERSLEYNLPIKCGMMTRIIEACRKPDSLNTAYLALGRLELYANTARNVNIALHSRKLFEAAKARANKSRSRRRS